MVRTKRWTILLVMVAVVAALALGACSPNSSGPEKDDDQALWSKIIWTGSFANSRSDAQVVMNLTVTAISPGSGCSAANKLSPNFVEAFVAYSYDKFPWRAGDPKNGNDGVLQNFFVWDDAAQAYKGGVFEWFEPGMVCGMINAQDGFNFIKMPCSGQKVAFALTNFAGTQRSTLFETVWP